MTLTTFTIRVAFEVEAIDSERAVNYLQRRLDDIMSSDVAYDVFMGPLKWTVVPQVDAKEGGR